MQNLYTVDSRHHDVEDDRVELPLTGSDKSLFAVGRRYNPVALLCEARSEQLA